METLPKNIGRYEVLSLIGRGAMGLVYKARDPLIGRIVAVKKVSLGEMLPPDQKDEFHERFFREARAAGNLKHPNVVTVHDVGEHEGVPYMAMEYLEGGSLSTLMKSKGPLPLGEAVRIVKQVALGLDYAHKVGIVHRDIKPDNILLDKEGRAVITDFGAARMQDSELTRTGEVLGTPYYMSPEQVLGEPLDGRSDLFSLGVIFYLMVTGKRPFRGDTVSTVCYHIVHSQPEPLSPDVKVPPKIHSLLDRLLAKKRDQRFPTGEALAAALDALGPAPPATGGPVSLTQTVDIATPTPGSQKTYVPPYPVQAPSEPTPPSFPAATEPGPAPSPGKKGLILAGLGGAVALGIAVVVVVILAGVFFLFLKPKLAERMRARQDLAQQAPPATNLPAAGSTGTSPGDPLAPASPPASNQPWTAPPPVTAPPPPPEPGLTPKPQPVPVSGTRPVTPPPSAPSPPLANPAIAAGSEVILREASTGLEMVKQQDFGRGFEILDRAKSRLDELGRSAGAGDQPALASAKARLEALNEQARQAIGEWAKPICAKARNTFEVATEGADDEEEIQRAYVEVYPVLKWKERLPSAVKAQAEMIAFDCKDNLNDEEWAQAEAMARGGK